MGSAKRVFKHFHLLFDVVKVFGQLHLTILDVFHFLFQQLAGVIMVFVIPLYFFLEFLHVDFYVPFDFGVSVIEHVLELGRFVLQVQNDKGIL